MFKPRLSRKLLIYMKKANYIYINKTAIAKVIPLKSNNVVASISGFGAAIIINFNKMQYNLRFLYKNGVE